MSKSEELTFDTTNVIRVIVRRGRKPVGYIRRTESGWTWHPYKSKLKGEPYPSYEACRKSVTGEDELQTRTVPMNSTCIHGHGFPCEKCYSSRAWDHVFRRSVTDAEFEANYVKHPEK